jgi:hypothetical protein
MPPEPASEVEAWVSVLLPAAPVARASAAVDERADVTWASAIPVVVVERRLLGRMLLKSMAELVSVLCLPDAMLVTKVVGRPDGDVVVTSMLVADVVDAADVGVVWGAGAALVLVVFASAVEVVFVDLSVVVSAAAVAEVVDSDDDDVVLSPLSFAPPFPPFFPPSLVVVVALLSSLSSGSSGLNTDPAPPVTWGKSPLFTAVVFFAADVVVVGSSAAEDGGGGGGGGDPPVSFAVAVVPAPSSPNPKPSDTSGKTPFKRPAIVNLVSDRRIQNYKWLFQGNEHQVPRRERKNGRKERKKSRRSSGVSHAEVLLIGV